MKQTVVSAELAPAFVPLDPEMFLHVALIGLSARAGLLSIDKDDCEGYTVPGIPWDHPMNLGVFAMQKEMRSLQVEQPAIMGAVLRFTALCSPIVVDPLVIDFVERDERGNVIALTEFLLRAAATADIRLGEDKLCHFDPPSLAKEASRYRDLSLAARAA